jgi:hypothetical protein
MSLLALTTSRWRLLEGLITDPLLRPLTRRRKLRQETTAHVAPRKSTGFDRQLLHFNSDNDAYPHLTNSVYPVRTLLLA